jgi:hypothetical protein
MLAQQSFGLFVEPLEMQGDDLRDDLGEDQRATTPDCYWLELPAGPVRLLEREGELTAIGVDEGSPEEIERSLILETIRHERQPYLAMLSRPGSRIRVNGAESPAAAVLRVRDQVSLDGAFLLHVSQYSRPYRGPAPEEIAKGDCPVCLTPIAASSLVFICPNCQAAMHAQGAETPADDRLECHLTSSTCPRCNQPMSSEEGYAFVPQF